MAVGLGAGPGGGVRDGLGGAVAPGAVGPGAVGDVAGAVRVTSAEADADLELERVAGGVVVILLVFPPTGDEAHVAEGALLVGGPDEAGAPEGLVVVELLLCPSAQAGEFAASGE